MKLLELEGDDYETGKGVARAQKRDQIGMKDYYQRADQLQKRIDDKKKQDIAATSTTKFDIDLGKISQNAKNSVLTRARQIRRSIGGKWKNPNDRFGDAWRNLSPALRTNKDTANVGSGDFAKTKSSKIDDLKTQHDKWNPNVGLPGAFGAGGNQGENPAGGKLNAPGPVIQGDRKKTKVDPDYEDYITRSIAASDSLADIEDKNVQASNVTSRETFGRSPREIANLIATDKADSNMMKAIAASDMTDDEEEGRGEYGGRFNPRDYGQEMLARQGPLADPTGQVTQAGWDATMGAEYRDRQKYIGDYKDKNTLATLAKDKKDRLLKSLDRGAVSMAGVDTSTIDAKRAEDLATTARKRIEDRVADEKARDKAGAADREGAFDTSTSALAAFAQSGKAGLANDRDEVEAVKELQVSLNSRNMTGEDGDPLKVDGMYDDNTVAAVKKYQEREGLTVDGDAGPDTINSLTGRDVPPSEIKKMSRKDRREMMRKAWTEHWPVNKIRALMDPRDVAELTKRSPGRELTVDGGRDGGGVWDKGIPNIAPIPKIKKKKAEPKDDKGGRDDR